LGQVDLSLEILSLHLGGNTKVAHEDHVDLVELYVIVEVGPMVISPVWLWCCQSIFFLLAIQISSALFQNVSACVMNLISFLSISRTLERPSLLLIGLPLVHAICSVDLAVLLLLIVRGPLVTCVKESGSSLGGLHALIGYCQ
jgi:hypothetical protein